MDHTPIFFSHTGLTGYRICDDELPELRTNLRSDFEGDLPCTGATMEGSPKKKSDHLKAGETKTSVLRQELNMGKGGKSKWSWKEREDDMRELERKNLEQKREIQKLKKQNETAKEELSSTKEELERVKLEFDVNHTECKKETDKFCAEKTDDFTDIIAEGKYLDSDKGKTYIILEDDVAQEKDKELCSLKDQVDKLEEDNVWIRNTLDNTEEQKNLLIEKIDRLIEEKNNIEASIKLLLKEKDDLENEKLHDSEKLKSDFETVLNDIQNQLQEKEREKVSIENEKNQLLEELNVFVEAKKQLEFELDNMNGVIQEQVEKIDELSVKIFGRDEDLRKKLEEVEKAREECRILQESNNISGSEQEAFMNNIWDRLGEITKLLQEVAYCKTVSTASHIGSPDESLDSSQDIDAEDVEFPKGHNNNEDALNEELNSSIDQMNSSTDSVQTRSQDEIRSKFEEVKNLLLQKLAHIDNVVSNKDYQINKCVYQTNEWKTNCEKLEKDASALRETFEGLLEIKEKESHDLREQMENIREENNAKISELEKGQQQRLAGMECSDSYYREQVESITIEFEKKSKEYESLLAENTYCIDNLKQESHLMRNEIDSKDRELSEISRKFDLSLSEVEEHEKVIREENERYFAEEIARIQNDCRNKMKKLECEKHDSEAKLSNEYENKIKEIETAYEKQKTNDIELLHKSFEIANVSTQCIRPAMDKCSMTFGDYSFETEELEEELERTRDTLTSKVRDYELLQAKYDAQHRLIDFVTLSLEQERAKKSNSNEEILNVLEKLEQKMTESIHYPNEPHNIYASESSINSLATESLPESYSYTNPSELNTTWPPKFSKRDGSPIRRWNSLGVLEQDQEKRKELIERLRTEISVQLNGITPSTRTVPSKAPFTVGQKSPHIGGHRKPWLFNIDEKDGQDHIRSNNIEKNIDLNSDKSYGKDISPPSTRNSLKNEHSHDSGLDQNDDLYELISYPNQLHNVVQMFKKLDEQHEQFKEETNGSADKNWSLDVENWKNHVQHKLSDIKPLKVPSERSDSALSTISCSSILFHPNDNEVKAIIEKANKMYDSAHFLM